MVAATREAKRSEAWLTTAIASGIIAGLSAATVAAWAWWIESRDGFIRYCERGEGSNITYGKLVWRLVPPGPHCIWPEQTSASRINWPWAILVGIALISAAIACYATVRHLSMKRHLRPAAGAGVP